MPNKTRETGKELIEVNIFDRVFQDNYDPSRVVEIRDTTTRGTLVVRVNDLGKLLKRELYMVMGAFVSGVAGDPNSIKTVYARALIDEGKGKATIKSNERIDYEPTITVVEVGSINYLDSRFDQLFEPIGSNM